MAAKDAGWWDDFFPAFRPIFGKVSQKATNAQVKFIIKKLNLAPGRSFLDCPCGIGRIAMPLAKAGVKVTGVDITQSYLDELTAKAKKRGLRIDLQHGDMRRIGFDSQFDAAGNLWTSFGYFEKESDNLLVLEKIFRALKPGGKFLLHVVNRDWVMAHFQANEWSEAGGGKVLEERGFDFATSISTDKWTFIKNGHETTHETAIRMYSYHEMLNMFRKVGFVDIEGYGSVMEEPISLQRFYMFIVGARPGKKGKA